MHVTVWSDTTSACTYYRAVVPLRGLQRAGVIDGYTLVEGTLPGFVPEGDILLGLHLYERWQAEEVEDFASRGLVVIDDDHDLDETTRGEPGGSPHAAFVAIAHRFLPVRPDEGLHAYLGRALPWYVEYAWPCRQETGRGLAALARPADTQALREPRNAAMDAARVWLGGQLADILLHAPSLTVAQERARQLAPLEGFRRIISAADLVTVSTHRLCQVLAERYGVQAQLLPNCIDLTLPCYQPERRQRSHDGILLGWAGSGSHRADFTAVIPALARILAEYDGTAGRPVVRLMVGGDRTVCRSVLAALPGAEELARQVDALPRDGAVIESGVEMIDTEDGRFRYCLGTRDIESSPLMYDDVDIGLVPVEPEARRNLAKSDIKGLEMAGMSVPAIASPLRSYRAHRQPGTGCLLLAEHTTEDWYQAIRTLVEDEALRRRMADEALAFAQTRSIDAWAPRWAEVYENAAQAWRRRHPR